MKFVDLVVFKLFMSKVILECLTSVTQKFMLIQILLEPREYLRNNARIKGTHLQSLFKLLDKCVLFECVILLLNKSSVMPCCVVRMPVHSLNNNKLRQLFLR